MSRVQLFTKYNLGAAGKNERHKEEFFSRARVTEVDVVDTKIRSSGGNVHTC